VNGVLLLPLGLAAALIVAGTVTAFAATDVGGGSRRGRGAAAGLILLAWPHLLDRATPAAARQRASDPQPAPRRWPLLGRWPLLAAVGALLVYGAPVLLSGRRPYRLYQAR